MGPGNRSRHLQSDHMLAVRFVETWTELREAWVSREALTLPSQNVTMTESQQETESRVPWSSANFESLRAKDLDFSTMCLCVCHASRWLFMGSINSPLTSQFSALAFLKKKKTIKIKTIKTERSEDELWQDARQLRMTSSSTRHLVTALGGPAFQGEMANNLSNQWVANNHLSKPVK